MPKKSTPEASVMTLENIVHKEIPFDQLVPALDNVRDEIGDVHDLAESIAQHGLLQPLLVTPVPDVDKGDDWYRIIAGHRRHQAIWKLKSEGRWPLEQLIPCSVRAVIDDAARVEAMLIENMQRSDLNPVEEAIAFRRLTDEFGLKQKELAAKVCRSTSYVSARLALLSLPDEVLDQVRTHSIPLDIAGELAKADPAIARKLTHDGTTVPQSYQITEAIQKDKDKKLLAELLKRAELLGIAVTSARGNPHEDKVIATYTSVDDFDTIKPSIPKTATAYVIQNTYSTERVKIEVRRPLTEGEKEKLRAKRIAEQEAVRDELATKRAERFEHEQAGKSPELLVWEAACADIDIANEAAREEYDERQNEVRAAWPTSVKATEVARWAMLQIIAWSYASDVLEILDVHPTEDQDDELTLANWCAQGATQLVAAVAAALLTQPGEQECVEAVDSYNRFFSKAGLVRPERALYPPKPGEVAADDDVVGDEAPDYEDESQDVEA